MTIGMCCVTIAREVVLSCASATALKAFCFFAVTLTRACWAALGQAGDRSNRRRSAYEPGELVQIYVSA
jgi:hypothetical protein